MMTTDRFAEYRMRVDLGETVVRVTWQEPEHGIVESQRMNGQDCVLGVMNSTQPIWFSVEEWRGHAIGWVRLGTMVRSRAGRYRRLRVN
jgi:hypothetical protein